MGGFKSLSEESNAMDEGGYASALVPKHPDYGSAIVAISAASDLLALAREKLAREDAEGAMEGSRDAIRLASSAILFRDGYVSGSLEDTADYIAKKYPGLFPIEGWERIEIASSPRVTLYKMFLSAMGKIKKPGRESAEEAIITAETFIESARSELMQ